MENLEGLEILENFISVWLIRESLEASLLVMKKKMWGFQVRNTASESHKNVTLL